MQKKRKKVLVISNMYPSQKYPHYGVFVQHTVDVLSKNDYVIDKIVLYKQDIKILRYICYILFYLKIVILGLFKAHDVLYVHYASHCAIPVLFLKRFRNIPLVVNVHGNDLVPETEADKKYEKLVKKMLERADVVVCPSTYFEQIVHSIIPEKETVVYPSGGVDTKLFRRMSKTEAREHMGLSAEKKYLGYVSRIEKNKGWDIFLDACAEYLENDSEIELVIVGDGAEKREFDRKIEQLSIFDRINIYPFLNQSELVYMYNALDVFVFPTYRKSESLGLVGLEAMACETISVLPDQYGPASYGEDGKNAYMFKTGDVDSLKETISKAMHEDNEILRRQARVTACSYANTENETILINIFDILLKGAKDG